ncbi:MAG: FAD-binding oxidoreductase [Zoogloeaceae bacterium]|jgi:FAD/FMN-containing dehydrogenase|nr:FAD-binding oxidoreductase [Zoogloeaceae bacterium]
MNAADISERLAGIVGARNVATGAEAAPHLVDWRRRYSGEARCVVKPASTAEVAAVVAFCAEARIPMVPQGGNTGLVGGATPRRDGDEIVINLSRMKRIREIDIANDTLTAEAGCLLAEVQAAAADAGRLFPLSLASEGSCEIGGNLSTNAGGTAVLRYGNMRELTLGLEAVLPDGRVWHGLRGLRKDNTGYDLKHLFIGAEGTLGIITAAVLKLFPLPRRHATAWLALRDPAAAVALLSRLRGVCGERLAGFEIIGRPALELMLKHIPGARDPFAAASPWYVLVELADTLAESDPSGMLETLLGVEIEAGRVTDAAVAQDLAQRQTFWQLREQISEAQRIEGISIKHDIAVPVSRIAEFIARADAALARAFPAARIVTFGHIGDGNLHYNLSRREVAANAELIARAPEVNRIVHDIVAELGGSISAEHGLGQLKRSEILRYKSAVEMDLMRAVKQALDPHGLMNPGKVL